MNDKSLIWYLDNVNLFEIFCPRKLAGRGDKHDMNRYNKGSYIYFPDEPSDKIYFIEEGRVRIGYYTEDGKDVTKAILAGGEIFGEMALAGENRRVDFAQAITPLELCPMPLSEFEMLLRDNAELSIKFAKFIGFRLLRAERRIDSLVFKDARTRVVDFIKDLASNGGKRVGTETLVKHYYTHQDIANLTGTSRQTVTTVLNELKDKNLINFERNRILIRDMARL